MQYVNLRAYGHNRMYNPQLPVFSEYTVMNILEK